MDKVDRANKPEISHLEDASDASSFKHELAKTAFVLEDAKAATTEEHELTLAEAFKHHKKAIFWAAVLSLTIVMEGYDNILISSFYGYPSFQRKYGEPVGDGSYQLSGKWQSALGAASSVGTIFGVFANGFLIERFGHRMVIMASLVVMSAFIFIPFFAPSVGILVFGQVMCGLPWGIFATMGPTYSSEVCPMALRGHLTAYVNMCWAIGQFIAAGVLQGLVDNTTEWSYRVPFAVQWAWPIPLFILTFLAPNSPWWLVRKGDHEGAEKSLKRLASKAVHHRIPNQVALMIHTNALEQAQHQSKSNDEKGWRGYLQCFKGTNLRRTEIACMAIAGQVASGSTLMYSPSYFFSNAGLSADNVYKLNLGVTGISFTGCVVSWFLLPNFGRRTIYVTGYTILSIFLLLTAILATPNQSDGLQWTQAVFTIIWVGTYASTIGPLGFTILSEISATRLRAQTVAIGRNAYNLISLISQVIEPYMINPTEGNLKGKTAYIWFGTAFPTLLWCYFRLPETKGRTYEELDILFERRIGARKFSSTEVELEHVEVDLPGTKE
ncbi:hypothetical protein PSN45_004156 [Yamadazyma tenuis]|uniref:Sugar transporter n=1 Tax=Candida tenuis (strain ATCC 10573 / BCRC 21748 / CBS 615 / JCM 9827 / NBRC 10315 / NRRL Y-1498 / VKM Y-70) TaxID=590646 RepID=G3B446_CANTC|nr:sugar transporter [Yamadazyma tenuis ATCC 10573]EGV63773.1 sugar transporter [Yamadazyma tenuis ATCC 10573]WEJ96615.1 hypothetical protein PSN45_004156 [Yamadazyma tenuis]